MLVSCAVGSTLPKSKSAAKQRLWYDRIRTALEEVEPLGVIKRMLNKSPKLENSFAALQLAPVDCGGMTLLHWACFYAASLEVIQFLTRQFPAALTMPATLCRRAGCTPLHIACWSSLPRPRTIPRVETIRFLAKANPATLQLATEDGHTPLHLACSSVGRGADKIIRFLAQEYPPSCLRLALIRQGTTSGDTAEQPEDFGREDRLWQSPLDILMISSIMTRHQPSEGGVCEEVRNLTNMALEALLEAITHCKTELPKAVVEHMMTASMLSWPRVEKEGDCLPATMSSSLLHNDALQDLLRDGQECTAANKFQQLILGMYRMNQAGRKQCLQQQQQHHHQIHSKAASNQAVISSRPRHIAAIIGTNVATGETRQLSSPINVLAAVQNNLDCLFLHLREQDPMTFVPTAGDLLRPSAASEFVDGAAVSCWI